MDLILSFNYKEFCPACGDKVTVNKFDEYHCSACDLWYTAQYLFGYTPRHLTTNAKELAKRCAKCGVYRDPTGICQKCGEQDPANPLI